MLNWNDVTRLATYGNPVPPNRKNRYTMESTFKPGGLFYHQAQRYRARAVLNCAIFSNRANMPACAVGRLFLIPPQLRLAFFLRNPSRACISRWPGAKRLAVLYQCAFAGKKRCLTSE